MSENTLPFDIFEDPLKIAYDISNDKNAMEIISIAGNIYCETNISILEKILYNICVYTLADPILKLQCCRYLLSYHNEHNKESRIDKAYNAIEYTLYFMENSHFQLTIEAIKMLSNSEKFKAKTTNYFLKLLNSTKTETSVIYKTITSLQPFLQIEGYNYIISQRECDYMYSFLSAQELLLFPSEITCASEFLLNQAKTNKEYNLKADACDILLRSNCDAIYKQEAEQILKELGGKGTTIFSNNQNAHDETISNSALKALIFLKNINPVISIETVKNEMFLDKRMVLEDNKLAINLAFERLENDHSFIKEVCMNLKDVILKLYSFIDKHEYRGEMMKRLYEELLDMSGTCHTGFVNRLVNVLSGFTEFSLEISWKEQIKANLMEKLKHLLMLPENSDAMLEMTNEKLIDKTNYNRFIMKHINIIQQDMFNEFKSYITEDDFLRWFRDAMV